MKKPSMTEIASQHPSGVFAAILDNKIVTSQMLAAEIAETPTSRFEPVSLAFLANPDQITNFIAALKLHFGLKETPLVIQGTKTDQDQIAKETVAV
jgi:hypothetical protein